MSFNEKLLEEARELEKRWDDNFIHTRTYCAVLLESQRLWNERSFDERLKNHWLKESNNFRRND